MKNQIIISILLPIFLVAIILSVALAENEFPELSRIALHVFGPITKTILSSPGLVSLLVILVVVILMRFVSYFIGFKDNK